MISSEPGSLTRAAYEYLRAEILACRLLPGQRLKVAALCGRLGVSLGAVREALSGLAAEGLVVAEAQKGFRVSSVSAHELDDLTRTRVQIETLCLRSAIPAGDVAWEARIVSAFHRMSRTPQRAEGDEARLSDAWADAHRAFHAALVDACDSPWLLRLRDMLYVQSERYRRLSIPAAPTMRDLDNEHRVIMEAVLARDVASASELMCAHINLTTRLVRPLTEFAEESETRPAKPRQRRVREIEPAS